MFAVRLSQTLCSKVDAAMNEPIRPHPKNVNGPFYVEYGCCTACDVPMQEAPNHFAYDGDNHCYVCRQPDAETETTDMIGTALMAEFQCIRYRGDDPDVLQRFAELDMREICDIEPPAHINPVIRNHVRINVIGMPPVATPKELAQEFIDHLMSENNGRRQFKTQPIQISNNSALFQISWYDDHFHPIVFNAVSDSPAEWHIQYPLKNHTGDRGIGTVVSNWLNRNSNRFTNIRWYTESDWHHHKPPRSTPW
jgi:hypothetical protein